MVLPMRPTRPPVYIAGPFRADTLFDRALNVHRACLLSRFAVTRGLAPLCVHPAILKDAYGDDNSPAERAAGREATLALVVMVAHHEEGQLWIIEREDGSLSAGTLAEHDLFLRSLPDGVDPTSWIRSQPWSKWKDEMARSGMRPDADVPA